MPEKCRTARDVWDSSSLAEQLAEVESNFSAVSFENDLLDYTLPESEAVWLRGSDYYKGLAEFVRLSGARRVLEIGTLFGGSAIALAKYAETVIAADVDLSRAMATNLFCRNIVARQLSLPEDCLLLPLDGIDFIFVDIDHSGRMETQLHEKFVREYRRVVFYDDISLNAGMQDFWQRIEQEKVHTSWHQSGFGAVRYSR